MQFNLFINIYVDSNANRLKELFACFRMNCRNAEIDNVIAIYNNANDLDVYAQFEKHLSLEEFKKIRFVYIPNRPTYNEYFYFMKEYIGQINLITNADILFTPSQTKKIKEIKWANTRNVCLALSVWDINVNDRVIDLDSACLRDRVDSQDSWIFYDVPNKIDGADFTLGIAGCDNHIAYLLHTQNYKILNPSKDIRTYHYHFTGLRHYIEKKLERIQPPYHVFPTQYLTETSL